MDTIITTRRVEPDRFEVNTASRQRLLVEAGAMGHPETADGPAPMELMLASLATCSASTISDILEKMRLDVTDLRVAVDGARADRPPRVWTDIHLRFLVSARAPEDRLRHAAALTERTCAASRMLAGASNLTWTLIQVRPADPAETRPLRQTVLRPHQTIEELMVAGEDDPAAGWFVGVLDGEVIGTAGVFPEAPPGDERGAAWRVRSMAVEASLRRSGLGAMLLDACIAHAVAGGAELVWCTARVPAEAFYLRHGFHRVGDEVDLPGVGPHVRMDLELD